MTTMNTPRFTGLKTRNGRRIMEGDYVLMHWGGGRHRIHKVTFHQEANAIRWLLGAPDGKHTWNRWMGKDIRVIPAAKAEALWKSQSEVGPRLKPLGQHPLDKIIVDLMQKAMVETVAELLKELDKPTQPS